MKIKMKALAVGVAVMMSISTVFFSACDILNNFGQTENSGSGTTHKHTYATTWAKDENNHWHAATCEHTTLTKDKAEHTWDEGMTEGRIITYTCTVCEQTKTEEVELATYTVTFVYNDGVTANKVVEVEEGETVTAETPEYAGYTFDGWYTDEAYTAKYDFESTVTQDLTLYASWLEEGVTYYTVTYHLNYGEDETFSQKVKSGYFATRPTEEYERENYVFDDWYATADASSTFRFAKPITGNTDVYANWLKINVFEAENVDVTGMQGNGYSGNPTELDLICQDYDEDYNIKEDISGEYYVTYLYNQGLSITFNIYSDKAVSNAKLYLRLAAEFANFTLSSNNYTVNVNNSPVTFGEIVFNNVPESGRTDFNDYFISNISLKAGNNTITLLTSNNTPHLEHGTIKATAPMIDCIKIATDANIDWAEGGYHQNKSK